MRILISDILRKFASSIELDRTPTDKDLDNKKKQRMVSTAPAKKPVVNSRSSDDTVEHNTVKPTARPEFKPPRRKKTFEKGDWDSKSHRTEYMKEWRAEGNDVTTGNKYVKKNKSK